MLLVLALVWGTFLVWWLHSRALGTFGDSIGTFRRHLTVLERTAPATVRPANRLRSSGPQMLPAYRPRPGVSGPRGSVRRQGSPGRSMHGVPTVSMQAVQRRRQTLRRRRDVLFILAVVVVATLVMAAATRSSTLVFLQLCADVAMLSYIGLLVRLRNLAAERDVKLTFLPRDRAAGPGGSVGYRERRPVAPDGHATDYGAAGYGAPAYGVPSYDVGGYGAVARGRSSGYGELALRRAAN